MQSYDDVSADDLIKYLESVIDSTPGVAVAPAADSSTPLGDAQPFDYAEDLAGGDVEELAASTNNPNYAAKMLGYDRNTFGDILHRFKPDNGLGPADNVIWHDNGDVYFQGNYIANFHDWAN